MNIEEFVHKWGTDGPKLLLSHNTRTSTAVEVQEEIDELVEDLHSALVSVANAASISHRL